MTLLHSWTPFSWEKYPLTQGVVYTDKPKFEWVMTQLKDAPPLVTEREIKQLKHLLAKAGKGQAFILQGGDCSELFSDCNQRQICNKFKILLQMSLILIHSLKKPVVRIGRIAGQYAKPRSALNETINNLTLPAYRGDMINDYAFTKTSRQPDPARMLQAYHYAGLTLNYLRALASDGFADLHHSDTWQLDFLNNHSQTQPYQAILKSVMQALQFFESVSGLKSDALKRVNFFSSHEALHLPYDAALTRQVSPKGRRAHFYNLSTHFPWIGMRTLHADSAHVEYLKGIENPIGLKVSSSIDFNELMQIISTLNPNNKPGKIVLIHRFGKDNIAKKLPRLLEKISETKTICTVICDPMHGNTYTTKQGIKTRYVNDILNELHLAFSLHKQSNVPLAGIHFEVTGEDVTECVGGFCGLQEEDLSKTYMSLVDPRLNYSQALEMALKVAEWHQ